MTLIAVKVATIARVADKSSKRLPLPMEKSVAKFVQDLVVAHFPPNAAGKAHSQREIARALGISQPVLSQALSYDSHSPTALGIGINGLLALREFSGQSIDVILGLAIPSRAVDAQADLAKLVESADELGRIVTALVQKPSPNSKLGKALREVERLKMRIAAEKQAEDRIRRVNEMPVPSRRKASVA